MFQGPLTSSSKLARCTILGIVVAYFTTRIGLVDMLNDPIT